MADQQRVDTPEGYYLTTDPNKSKPIRQGWVTTLLRKPQNQPQWKPPALPQGYQWQETTSNKGIPYMRATRWTPPDYTPTYWEDPTNVSRWYKSWKDGTAPDWLNGDAIDQAYQYMKYANKGIEDTGWKWLHPDDPGRSFLQGIESPPLDVTLPHTQYQDMVMADMFQRPTTAWTDEDFAKLDDYNRQKMLDYADAIAQTVPLEQAPWWQQAYVGLSSQPWAMGALQAGALGLITGGPAGALVGGGLGAGLGALSSLPAGSPIGEIARETMQLLDLPYQQVERLYGTVMQYISPDRPYLGEDLDRLARELQAAWQASGGTMEAGLPFEVSTTEPGSAFFYLDQAMKLLGQDDTAASVIGKAGRFDPLNMVGAVEWTVRSALQGMGFNVDPSVVKLAGLNQAYVLDPVETPEGTRLVSTPVDVGLSGMAALVDARRRILQGEDPTAVQEELKYRYGVSGQVTDLAAGIIFDPLNIAPEVGTHAAGKVFSLAGWDVLGQAFETATGPLEAVKRYQTAVRTGIAGAVEDLTLLQKMVANLTEEGKLKELRDVSELPPLQRALTWLTELTPSSKARIQIGIASENIGNLMLMFIDDPDGLVKAWETIATQRPSEAAKISAAFGSPEMYTSQRVIAAFMETLNQEKLRFDTVKKARDDFNLMAQSAGMTAQDLARLMTEVEDPANVLHQLETAARNLDTPEAKNFVQDIDSGIMTPDIVKALQELFTGKDPVAYDAHKFAAQLYGKFEEHAGKFLAEAYKLGPDHVILRYASVLKKAQSFLLLGLNPAYLFNNVTNNAIMMAAGGIFGLHSEAKIDRFFLDDVGMMPPRYEAGVGAAGILPEERIQASASGVEELRTTGAGEVAIRSATHPPGGFEGAANRALNGLNKLGVISEWSRAMESKMSKQAFYVAYKKDWAGRWKRNVGFRMIEDPALVSALRQVDPGLPEAVYRMIEGSINEKQLRTNLTNILNGAYREYALDYYLPDLARELGMDVGMVKDTLGPLFDDLKTGLQQAGTGEEAGRVIRGIENQAQTHADEMTARQLIDRAKQAKELVQSGGWIEAIRLLNEMAYDKLEKAAQHAQNWQDVFDLAATMEANGASKSAINAMFRDKYLTFNKDYNRVRAQSEATYQGIFEAWGAGDEDVRAFLDAYRRQSTEWDNYFELVQRRRDEVHRTSYPSTEARIAAWQALELELHDEFINTQSRANGISSEIDNFFVDVIAKQFGDEAGVHASTWREHLRALEDERQMSMRTFRESMLNKPADVRRAEYPKFYNEEYLPTMMGNKASQDIALYRLYQEVLGETPPTAPPTTAPPPPVTPAPVPPTGGEAPRGPQPPEEQVVGTPGPSPYEIAKQKIVDIAKEYGLDAETPDGKPIPLTGRISHAYNIMRQFGGEDVATLPQSALLELPEPQVRDIFRKWQQSKIDAANAAAVRQAELAGDVSNQFIEGGRENLPDHMQALIVAEAQRMLDELPVEGVKTGAVLPDGSRIPTGENPEWYGEEYAIEPLDKNTVVNSLQRIIDGGGRDVPTARMKTLRRVKQIVLGHLMNGVQGGPPSIAALMYFGREAEAASLFSRFLQEGLGQNVDDAFLADMVGGPENLNRIFTLMMEQENPIPEPQGRVAPTPEEIQTDVQASHEFTDNFKQQAGMPAGIRRAESEAAARNLPPAPEAAPPPEAAPVRVEPVTPEPVSPPALGEIPPGVAEDIGPAKFDGIYEGDFWMSKVQPILTGLEEMIARQGPVTGSDLSPEVGNMMRNYENKLMGDMATSRIATMRWAETQRDFALLNYSRRRGFDQAAGVVYPYQYFYTRSGLNYFQRAIDKPVWFADWARIRSFQDRNKRQGYPSRLSNKVKIAAPYLPDWAGDSVYYDPVRKFFPFEEFLGPLQQLIGNKRDIERQTEWMLQRWVNDGTLTEAEAQEAVSTKNQAYQSAMNAVQADQANTADYNWLNTIMQPALYLTLPAFMLTGKNPATGESDMSLLPITRTGLALQAGTQGTPLEAVGGLIGNVLSGPEMLIRRKKGLDEFGSWGDYYIDRQLSNMAADGTISTRDAVLAMQERQGVAFEMARERVRYEIGVGQAGAGFLQSALTGQAWKNPPSFLMATLFGWMPQGLLPEGELEQRGLANIYKNAREEYNQGNTDALQEFFSEHPEYEARLALFDTPDERLRQFLVSEVYDRYFALDSSLQKQLVRDQLGPDFQDFLAGTNHDTLDPNTLAMWSRMMGGAVPNVEQVQQIATAPDILIDKLQQATPEEAATVDTYRQLRNQLFPNWYALQSRYYSLPPKSQERKQLLELFPQLKEYWTWSRAYKDRYPAIEKYTQKTEDIGAIDYSWIGNLDPMVVQQLYTYYAFDEPITSAALEILKEVWTSQGRPGEFDSWIDNYVKAGILP